MDDVEAPLEVARAMARAGATREAELVLRGAAARNPLDGEHRRALRVLERDGRLPEGVATEPSLELIDRWIRAGMLVEALAVLGGIDLGGTAREWGELLGELLAPVPAHAEGCFVDMHRQLLSGGASVALTILEDRCRQGPVPAWATRRLSLLRWMLLDNAQLAGEEGPQGEAPSALAGALRPALAARNIEEMLAAAEAFAEAHPDADSRDTVRILDLLVKEMNDQVGEVELSIHTVPVFGRPAAAMQLRMANFQGAFSIYSKLSTTHPGDSRIRELFDAVRGIRRVLEGRSPVDRTFPPPPRADLERELGIAPSFADKTAADSLERVLEQVREVDASLLESPPSEDVTKVVSDPLKAYSEETRMVEAPESRSDAVPPPEAPRAEFTDETRPVFVDELPLAAFDDEETVERALPSAAEKLLDVPKKRSAEKSAEPKSAEPKSTALSRDTEKLDMDEIAAAIPPEAFDTFREGAISPEMVAAAKAMTPVGEPMPQEPSSLEISIEIETPEEDEASAAKASEPKAAPSPKVPVEAYDTMRDPPTVVVQQIKGVGGDD